MDAQADPPARRRRSTATGLDALQADAAAAVAGDDRLVLVVGPAGAGKTRMLAAAVDDLRRAAAATCSAVAPTAKAARALERDTGMPSRHGRQAAPRMATHRPATAARVPAAGRGDAGRRRGRHAVDPGPAPLVDLAERNGWRLVLVGDPRQLQGVGRGGLFAELCATGRVDELERLHRFTHQWEAAASLQLRRGDPAALDAYEAHGRIVAGTLDDHLDRIADTLDRPPRHAGAAWRSSPRRTTTSTPSTTPSRPPGSPPATSTQRWRHGSPPARPPTSVTSSRPAATTAASSPAPVSRSATATPGPSPPSRDDGSLTVTHQGGHGDVTLPADYVARPRPARLRRHRARLAIRHRRRRHRPRLTGHHPPRPLRRRHPRPRHATRCVSSPTATTSPKPATSSKPSSPSTGPTSPPPPNAAPSPTRCHRPASSPTRRCEVPEWFPALLADAQRDLHAAEENAARTAARRAEATVAVATADAALATVAAATVDDRDALRAAEARAVDARRVHAGAEGRLASRPRRERRSARHDLVVAERQLERAEDYLARTRQRTAPADERHTRAVIAKSDAHDELRTCDTVDRLDAMTPSVGEHRRRVRALTTWKQWADGQPVPDRDLRTDAAILNQRAGLQRQLAAALPHRVRPSIDHSDQGTVHDLTATRSATPELGIGR